jgi:hypothetical protein
MTMTALALLAGAARADIIVPDDKPRTKTPAAAPAASRGCDAKQPGATAHRDAVTHLLLGLGLLACAAGVVLVRRRYYSA